jgi:phosphate/sulfate permease
MEIYFAAIVILAVLAVSDLVVGVSNDAVNFLNSAIGSRVAPRHIVMIIASLGMLAGVLFSKGMMEVARKGIFHPEFFTMPELMIIFLAVMLTDVLLLDLYNTFGLPTSTTVSIVFELLGAAVAVSLIKVSRASEGFASLVKYINTAKALAIISGILLSVVVAFICGAVIQFLSRLLFTFDFAKRLKRYGAIWGGLALASITYFILIKGAKGSAVITPGTQVWLQTNAGLILFFIFLICAVILQLLMWFSRVNILKPIVLIGTFALAMAFAANDLVNFIGVPLAGLSSYQAAGASSNPLTTTMHALQKATPSHTLLLLTAGIIMAITLWISRKARTVTYTEINLGRQEEGHERFGSSPLSRTVVRMVTSLGQAVGKLIPSPIKKKLNGRFDMTHHEVDIKVSMNSDKPAFDLVRASVNLMVASALISFATSMKLPLSTTYVTFMVAMGTSFSDRAWDRDSAVFRITGVLAVIGGWFLTALMAFTVSAAFAFAIYYLKAPAVILILGLAVFFVIRTHYMHKNREKETSEYEVFNLKKVKDGNYAVETTFKHVGIYLQEVAKNLNLAYEGLAAQNRQILKSVRKETKKIQTWANIIVANVFKTLRLLEQEKVTSTHEYAQSISVLQEIAECHRDSIMRAYDHINNHHKGLLPVQLEELKKVKNCILNLLEKTSDALMKKQIPDFESINRDKQKLNRMIAEFDKNQVKRIQDNTSKTRLSILFYGFTRDSKIIADQTFNLLKIFQESFPLDKEV